MTIQEHVVWKDFNDDLLGFYAAIGVDRINLDIRRTHLENPDLDFRQGKALPDFFERAKEKVAAHGMELWSVFMSAWDEITYGASDRDDKIDAWNRMLEAVGNAGIGALGYNFKPLGNFRTPADTGRGGVAYSTFDYAHFMANRPELREPQVTEAEMWEHMSCFLQGVIPVAEKVGVRMALHPDDPPIPEPLGGVAQVCSSTEQFNRILDEVPSDSNGLLFCQGCFTELLGDGVYDWIADTTARNKIVYVHFRNVRGQLPRFVEVFMDEGDIDMKRSMEVYRDNGFNGPYMMDHTPRFPQEGAKNGWPGKAFAVGYIRALIQEVYGS